jgi:uncharacterized membrane protein/uncharacterized protein (UPF0548 family)
MARARTPWRWGRGWSERELQRALALAEVLPLNFEEREEDMTLERGWSQVESKALVAREAPGAPVEGGPYALLRETVRVWGFSDTRIVRPHFHPGAALRGRAMLLELKSMGLRFLCSVRVGAVLDLSDARRTSFGYRLDTLAGHVEAGREWFLLTKDHATGEVRFHVRAAWRPGDFPTWWSRLGFQLLGRRTQRAWHHLCHVRLRRLVREALPGAEAGGPTQPGAVAALAGAGALDVERLPVTFFSQKGGGRRRSGTEAEVERVRPDRTLNAVGFGVLAGMRSFSAPALLAHLLVRSPTLAPAGLLHRVPRPRLVARGLTALALGELVGDKLPFMPARTTPPALAGRVLTGALTAAAISAPGGRRLSLSRGLLGAGAAVASAFTFARLRGLASGRLGVPNVAAGLLEDALVLGLGAALTVTASPGGPAARKAREVRAAAPLAPSFALPPDAATGGPTAPVP